MKIKGEDIKIEELLKDTDLKSNFHNDYGNGIYLSNKQIEILNKYKFNYLKYSNLKSLIFDIENYLNDSIISDVEDLEWLSQSLSELNYYHNTDK